MKRIALFLALAALLTLNFSCNNKKIDPIGPLAGDKPVYTFTHEDTVEIQSQVDAFVSNLEKGDIRGAVDMLNFLAPGDSIEPLDALQQRRQAMTLTAAKGVKYEVRHMILRTATNNEVKMDITLFDKPEGDPRPNKTSFFFRPVKFEGKWYLTVWDNITNTNDDRNKD